MMSGCDMFVGDFVDYKMLLYAHKAFYDHVPPNICDMITKNKPRRQLRSSEKCMLVD